MGCPASVKKIGTVAVAKSIASNTVININLIIKSIILLTHFRLFIVAQTRKNLRNN